MSFKHVHDVLESDIPKHLKLTAVVIAEFADLDTGECWPSVETIARRCSADPRTVQRNIRELENAGIVKRLGKHRLGTWIYRVTLPETGGVAFCRGDTSVTEGGDMGVTEGVTPASPKPSLNHQKNHHSCLRFEDFWRAYPVKKNKAGALKAWKAKDKAGELPDADFLIADVTKRLKSDRQWVEGYIPHAQTYLNGARWDDAIEPLKPNEQAKRLPRSDSELLALAAQLSVSTQGKTYDQLRTDCLKAMERA